MNREWVNSVTDIADTYCVSKSCNETSKSALVPVLGIDRVTADGARQSTAPFPQLKRHGQRRQGIDSGHKQEEHCEFSWMVFNVLSCQKKQDQCDTCYLPDIFLGAFEQKLQRAQSGILARPKESSPDSQIHTHKHSRQQNNKRKKRKHGIKIKEASVSVQWTMTTTTIR